LLASQANPERALYRAEGEEAMASLCSRPSQALLYFIFISPTKKKNHNAINLHIQRTEGFGMGGLFWFLLRHFFSFLLLAFFCFFFVLHVTFKYPILTDNCDSQNFPSLFLLLKEGSWEFILKVPTDFFIYPAPFECYVQYQTKKKKTKRENNGHHHLWQNG
jgi:hypothetical protein